MPTEVMPMASGVEQDAANRKMEYMLGVFADPIYFGDYPASIKERVSVLQPISSELVRLARDPFLLCVAGSETYPSLTHDVEGCTLLPCLQHSSGVARCCRREL